MSTRVNYQIQHLVRACFEEFLSVQEGRGARQASVVPPTYGENSTYPR
jgi:hypothetical protein